MKSEKGKWIVKVCDNLAALGEIQVGTGRAIPNFTSNLVGNIHVYQFN